MFFGVRKIICMNYVLKLLANRYDIIWLYTLIQILFELIEMSSISVNQTIEYLTAADYQLLLQFLLIILLIPVLD